MKVKFVQIILVLLLLVFSVQAQETSSFSILGPQQLDVFQCSPASFTFSVQNLGRSTSTYTFYLDGDASEWVNLNPVVFTLTPGSYQIVQQTFNVPCDAKNAELFTVVVSSTGEEQVLPQEVNVFKPENVHAKTVVGGQEIKSCQIATFNVELFNLVNFEETYSLSLDQFSESSLITPGELTLKPGESKEVIIDVEHKNCNEYGEFPFTLLVNTKNTELKGEVDLLLKVSSESIVDINIDRELFNNEFTQQTIPVTLTNKGVKETSSYMLKLEGPSWSSLDKEALTLAPGVSSTVNVNLNPVQGQVEDSVYDLKLTVTVSETGMEFVKEFQVRVHILTYLERNALYIASGSILGFFLLIFLVVSIHKYLNSESRKQRLELKRKEDEKRARQRARLKAELQAKKEELELKKAWEKEYYKTRYTLLRFFVYLLTIVALAGAGWLAYNFKDFLQQNWQYSLGAGVGIIVILAGIILAHFLKSDKSKLSRLEIELKKEIKKEEARKLKEKEKLEDWKKAELERLKVEVDSDYKEKNKIIPKDKIAFLERERKSFSWVWSLLLVVLTLALILGFSFYRELINGYFYEFYTAGLVLFLLVSFNLAQSLRISSSRYKLVLVKKKYEFNAGLNLLQQVSFSLINPVEKLKLRATTNPRTDIKPSPWVYDYFELTANTDEKNFESLTYNFKVKKTWIFGNNLMDIALVNFADGKWKPLKTEQVGEDNKYVYYQAKGNNLGIFAVTGKPNGKKSKNYWPLALVLGVLFLAAMSTVGYFTLNKTNNINGPITLELSKNGFKSLDLNQFFKDPDGDRLTFTSTNEGHLTVVLENSNARITPDYNWVGQSSVTFSADDGKGGSVESNKILVRVAESLIPFEYQDLTKQGIAALVVIIVFFVLIIYRKQLLDFLDRE